MPDVIDDKKIDDEKKDEKVGEKGDELTLESLKEIVTSQAGLIETLKTENTNNIAQVMQVVQDKYGLMESDMQNLANLLGGLANTDNNDDKNDLEDLTDPTILDKAMDKKLDAREKEKEDSRTKESKDYFKEYATDIQELMNEKGPDGKPLSQEARDGIKELLIKTFIDKTNSPTRDAHKNFKQASNTFFGLDKTHGFKGSDVDGTGSGGSDNKVTTKKVYKLAPEAKKMLKDLGETEEWGQEMLAKQAE